MIARLGGFDFPVGKTSFFENFQDCDARSERLIEADN